MFLFFSVCCVCFESRFLYVCLDCVIGKLNSFLHLFEVVLHLSNVSLIQTLFVIATTVLHITRSVLMLVFLPRILVKH